MQNKYLLSYVKYIGFPELVNLDYSMILKRFPRIILPKNCSGPVDSLKSSLDMHKIYLMDSKTLGEYDSQDALKLR